MNAETKRHIDAARQVLVGVVPNPTSQIDQITNALIYKFMDDMDQSAIKSGGDASFFTGDLERYAWTRLMDTRVGNQERMNLYSEALVKFSESKQLPELFRNIFKSAYLPYRSPDVLGLFLKEIDYFNYSHPEELGNAYEYLLSIMSSQGDAGQFRTPRHIIDFIVEAVNPTKDDKVLDPACGTGGFLISAYKNILKQHDGKDDPKKKEKPLTPDQRRTLMQNFEGYDIDPGMVRIAQVNMYLHQFKNPKIVQYDSLSMDERWNDKFDVILANPPFMSPKGGVSTHNKFGIQSTRSEVLFVDYIMNHLRPKGRAGIIVPEGIIFQSGTAYKQLRKNLVNDGLYAVVSLPSGVFQPYSGVKTSILFFDNEIAKKTKELLFIKINNDGFDLGAQRRPLKTSHLPAALEILHMYKDHVLSGKKITFQSDDEFAVLVSKEKISMDEEYNLSGDRYRITEDYTNTKYSMVELGEVCDFIGGYAFKSEELKKEKLSDEDLPVIKIGNVEKSGFLDISDAQYFEYDESLKKYLVSKNDILIAMTGATVGKVACSQFDNLLLNQRVGLVKAKENLILKSFLKTLLLSVNFYEYCQVQAGGGAQGNISPTQIQKYKIPLPPLDIQKEIVEQIEVKQKAIEGAREVIKNLERERRYFDKSFGGLDDIKYMKLGEICEINNKTSDPESLFGKSDFVYIDISSVENGTGKVSYDNKLQTNDAPSRARRVIKDNDVLLSTVRPNLMAYAYLEKLPNKVLASTGFAVITAKETVLPKYIYNILFTDNLQNQMIGKMGKGAYPSINQSDVESLVIPVPSLKTQEEIVNEYDQQENVIRVNTNLVDIMEKKINHIISELV